MRRVTRLAIATRYSSLVAPPPPPAGAGAGPELLEVAPLELEELLEDDEELEEEDDEEELEELELLEEDEEPEASVVTRAAGDWAEMLLAASYALTV